MPVKIDRYIRQWTDVNRKIKAAGTTGLIVMILNLLINQYAPDSGLDGQTLVDTLTAIFQAASPLLGAVAGYVVAEDKQK